MYFGGFKSIEDIADAFGGHGYEDQKQKVLDTLNSSVVHFAWYSDGCYDGHALVIYEKDGILYEVHGSHCSCYGLEGQWSPIETLWKAFIGYSTTESDEVDAYIKLLCEKHIKD